MGAVALFTHHSAIVFGCVLPCLAIIFLSAYAAASSHYHCRHKFLELQLNECQANNRIAEKEHALATKAMSAQLLSLTSANEGMQQQLLSLRRKEEEHCRIVASKEAEYVKRRSALEGVWLREREDILRAQDHATVSLQAKLRAAEAVCTNRRYQIEALNRAQEELQEVNRQHEQKNWELNDKLTECFRRLGNKRASSKLLTPFTRLRPSNPPSYYMGSEKRYQYPSPPTRSLASVG